jgi:hypothetical protein
MDPASGDEQRRAAHEHCEAHVLIQIITTIITIIISNVIIIIII